MRPSASPWRMPQNRSTAPTSTIRASWMGRDRIRPRPVPTTRAASAGAPRSAAPDGRERPLGGRRELLHLAVAHRRREAAQARGMHEHARVEERIEEALHADLGRLIEVAVAAERPLGEEQAEERAGARR